MAPLTSAVTKWLPPTFAARRERFPRRCAFRFSGGMSMKTVAKIAAAALACLAFGLSPAAAQKLTFTLNWVAGGDHAPYFYAQKMDWYRQAGIDIDFETGRGSAASAQKVGAGASQLGLSDMAGARCFCPPERALSR